MLEKKLQEFLTADNGFNLSLIDPDLLLLKEEYAFLGGRIDILALKGSRPVGIELKSKDYSSRQASAQLLNYIGFLSEKNGLVYFVAPKVKPGVMSTLKAYSEMTRYFEFSEQMEFCEVLRSGRKMNMGRYFVDKKQEALYRHVRLPVARAAGRIVSKILGL